MPSITPPIAVPGSGYKDKVPVALSAEFAHRGLRGLMADMLRYGVRFEPENGSGGGVSDVGDNAGDAGDDGQSETQKKPVKQAKKPVKSSDKSDGGDDGASDDARAALERQIRDLNERLAGYGDATPEEIKELRDLRRRADEEKVKRDKEAREAEERRLRETGDFETLKQRMAEEHEREVETIRKQARELEGQVEALTRQVQNMALSSAFSGSRFIAEETVLTPGKAHKIYGDHFEVENGTVVGYDAPKGAEKRTRLVDSRGRPLLFDEAMKRLVETDGDRDLVLRAKQKPGSGVVPSGSKPAEKKSAEISGIARIKAGLGALMGSAD
jgi:polyhydroxyalkanoate synthesis regulator phasin